mmetsp:Transcript_26832/g.88054  ORF Transcript_26832/g.88054 Transcript_26832/m.88054 type:complete len:278 (+) Transcript_26832:1319-2152(+)
MASVRFWVWDSRSFRAPGLQSLYSCARSVFRGRCVVCFSPRLALRWFSSAKRLLSRLPLLYLVASGMFAVLLCCVRVVFFGLFRCFVAFVLGVPVFVWSGCGVCFLFVVLSGGSLLLMLVILSREIGLLCFFPCSFLATSLVVFHLFFGHPFLLVFYLFSSSSVAFVLASHHFTLTQARLSCNLVFFFRLSCNNFFCLFSHATILFFKLCFHATFMHLPLLHSSVSPLHVLHRIFSHCKPGYSLSYFSLRVWCDSCGISSHVCACVFFCACVRFFRS